MPGFVSIRHRAPIVAVSLALSLALLGALCPVAIAAFTSSGTGTAFATAGELSAPAITNTSSGAGTTSLSWSSVSAPGNGGSVTYSVSRGGTAVSGCTNITTTSCNDSGLSKGSYRYVVTASWQSWTASTSTTIAVAFGAAAQLVFSTQPDGGATGGSAFPTQPKLTVEDAGGNIVTTDSSTVTLKITTGTPATGGPGTLSGCTQTGESNGVISFSGCSIDAAGTGYELHATDGTLTATDSAPFNVTATPLTAASVAQATATGAAAGTLVTPTFSTVSGDTYLIAIYCQGSSSACGSSPSKATISGGPFQSGSTNIGSEGTSNTKDCVEVIEATGNGSTGTVTVNGNGAGNVIFATVVHITNGTVKSTAPLPGSDGASSPATATLGTSPASWVVPVAVTDGNGATTISAPSGMTLLGNALTWKSGTTAGADLSVYFGQGVSGGQSFALNPTAPANGWATLSAQVG